MSLNTLNKIIDSGVKLTPMMVQYYDIKQKFPDMLLLFRMGDFYELFFDDAVEASKILNIALTHRGKLGDFPIPMAGIPHHAAPSYIDRITACGLKAAICDQLEDPALAKGIVKRGVSRIVSPGMPFDLDHKPIVDHSYIVSFFEHLANFYLVAIDFTTGSFIGSRHSSKEELKEAIYLLAPKELITYMGQLDPHPELKKYFENNTVLLTHLSLDYFDHKIGAPYIKKIFPSYESDQILKKHLPIFSPMAAISFYILSTQALEKISHLHPFSFSEMTHEMRVTYTTLTGLELIPHHRSEYGQTLLGFFDRTKTAMGSRTLKEFFIAPLKNIEAILKRQKIVKALLKDDDLRQEIREELAHIRDIERICAKLSMGKALGGDILALKEAIVRYERIHLRSEKIINEELLQKDSLAALLELSKLVTKAINPEMGALADKGNLILKGFNKERDRLASLAHETAKTLLEMENRYKQETNISTLKIRYNNITGHYIEISKGQQGKVPPHFIRRQTLVNAERFTTEELSLFEKEVLSANDKLVKIEREIFKEICELFISHSKELTLLSERLGTIDVFATLAHVAAQENFVAPTFTADKKIIKIEGAFHPLVKKNQGGNFTPHSIQLDEENYFGLITGPNMAGKTTVMRELAIIVHLAQMGSFIPAKSATLSIVDQLFSRLGASDNIQRGQSTFMVEMSETAEILRHATSHSLILLDELGRGTSTYDGLAIAWALTEHLVRKTKAFTLFATHYHELIEVATSLAGAKNLTVETRSVKDKVEFLYRLLEEPASQSFGIYVAKLAGIPKDIEDRAKYILHTLETKEDSLDGGKQLSFFMQPQVAESTPSYLVKIEEFIETLDPNTMTPIDALLTLNKLKKMTEQKKD